MANVICIRKYGSPEYKLLEKFCSALNALNPDPMSHYHVEDTYWDFGQDWQWTTIVRRYDEPGKVPDNCQVLYPATMETVLYGTVRQKADLICKILQNRP